jgi:hypothetical protein
LILFDLQVKEYTLAGGSMYREIYLLKISKIFLNAKLEYGLFPKGHYSLINTFNIKVEITNTSIEVSVRAINQIFKLVVYLNIT